MSTVERATVLNKKPEASFQSWIIRYAKFHGWRCSAMHDSRTLWWGSDRGIPDVILVRRDRLVFIECKSAKGHEMPEQRAWREELTAAGVEAYCFWTVDQERVREVLE